MAFLHGVLYKVSYLKEILAKNLRELRGGRNQSEVASAIGVSQSTYSRWEKGLQWIEDPDNLEKLAIYYAIPSTSFFYDPLLTPKTESKKLKLQKIQLSINRVRELATEISVQLDDL